MELNPLMTTFNDKYPPLGCGFAFYSGQLPLGRVIEISENYFSVPVARLALKSLFNFSLTIYNKIYRFFIYNYIILFQVLQAF